MNKKVIKYLYFDDKEDTANSVKDNLESESLQIKVKRELPWSEIITELLDKEKEFDGLILDWKLDGESDSKANFSSEALAQQCRTLQMGEVNKRKFSQNFPIILCSSQPGIRSLHEKDTTSINLFDGIFEKTELEDQEFFLISLIDSYRILNNKPDSIDTIIGLTKCEQDKINPSLISKISKIKNKQPLETVQFFLNEVINTKGALISEKVLAARLGIDIGLSKKGWDLLKTKINSFKYKGILSNNDTWWSDLINDWWEREFEGSVLKFLSATERIKLLEERFTELKELLIEPTLCEGAESNEFWTVCFGTNVPLAEVDGFLIDKHLHYPWQEKEYICLEEAKNETHRDKWNSLLSYEKERLKLYFE
jgi:hypothetical protein